MPPIYSPSAPHPTDPTGSAPSWARWLPTVGSIAGSVGGDILGGLAAPVTGGLVNPWDTSTALSALGGGVGQAIDNGMQGKNPLEMNDLTQAGIAGGSNLLGLGAEKLIGGVGTTLAQTGSDLAEKEAAQETSQAAADAADPVAQANAKNAIYGEAMGAKNAPYLKNGFQTVLDNATKLGVNTLDKGAPDLMSAIGHSATGGSEAGKGVVNDMVDDILSKHGGMVNLAGDANGDSILSNLAKSAEEQNARGLNVGNMQDTVAMGKRLDPVNNVVQQFAKQVAAMSPRLQSIDGTNLLAKNMTTEEADTLAKKLAAVAFDNSNLPAEGAARDAMVAKRNMAYDLFNYVRGTVDQQPGLSQEVQSAVSDPQLADKIDAATANISDPAVRQAVKDDLTAKLGGAKSIQDLRTIQSDYVDMSKLGDHVSYHNGQNTFTNGAKKLASLGADTAEKSGEGKVDMLKRIGLVAGAADEISGSKNPYLKAAGLVAMAPELMDMMSNPSLLTKLGGGADMLSNIAQPIGAGLGSLSQAPTQPGDQQMPQIPDIPNPYTQALQNALQMQSMESVDPFMTRSNVTSPSTSIPQLTQDSQRFNAAIAGMQNLLSLYDQAGGAQGPVGGILASLQSVLGGGEASRFNNAAQQEATQLSQLSGTPMQGSVPSVFENQPTSQANIQSMMNMLEKLSPQG